MARSRSGGCAPTLPAQGTTINGRRRAGGIETIGGQELHHIAGKRQPMRDGAVADLLEQVRCDLEDDSWFGSCCTSLFTCRLVGAHPNYDRGTVEWQRLELHVENQPGF